jgi:hypothetical protein
LTDALFSGEATMKQKIKYFFEFDFLKLEKVSNEWIRLHEQNTLGFVAINVSLASSINPATNLPLYTLAVLYGIRDISSAYTTDELKEEAAA